MDYETARAERIKERMKGPKNQVPVSQRFASVEAGSFYGYAFPASGVIESFCVDVTGAPKEATITLKLSRRGKNEDLSQTNALINGRNNFGSFEVAAGDRLLLELVGGQVQETWVYFIYKF